MTSQPVDVAILGAGTAGLNAWRAATAAGATTLVFDPGPLGTTCARVGCMPSKLLIAAAESAKGARHAGVFGVRVGDLTVDRVAVMSRLREVRDRLVAGTLDGMRRLRESGALVEQAAHFESPHLLRAGDLRVEARTVVIATGSSPRVPTRWQGLGSRVVTTDDLFELPELPRSVLVVGAGAIGIELGQALARLGARVTVIESIGRAAGIEDADIHAAFVGGVRADVDLHLRHELIDVQVLPEGIRVAFRGEGGEARDDTWDLVLVAAGREPRWSGIRLDAAGLDPMPPVAPGTGRVGDSHVFVAGDAGGSRMILHEAVHTGRIAGSNAARWPSVDASDRMTPLGLVFSDPQVALVGPRVSDLAAIDHVTGTAEFARNGRARVLDHTRGMVRVYADAGDGRLLGGGIVGPGAEHIGHLLAWAVQAGFTIDRALAMPFYHPVLEETLQDALRDARARLRPASS